MKTIKKIELRVRRIKVAESREMYQFPINTPSGVARAARSILDGEDQEVFLVFLLDAKLRILGYQEITRGGIDVCPVDLRVVFRAAVHLGASAIILCHCHPSGDSQPSPADQALTKRVQESGKLLGIQVLDHLIIGSTVVSMAEKGLLA